MNAPHRFILEPYNGRSTRHTCPGCGKPHEFTQYVDTETGELLPEHVGKCNRADACGYHYPPRDYFRDNGTRPSGSDGIQGKPEPPPRPPYLHDRAEVRALRAYPERNTLSAYWRERIGADRWGEVAKAYALGTWNDGRLAGAAVYWQVDTHGHVKAGKIMQYDPSTGKRSKEERTTSWVHFMRTRQSAGELNVEQCLFGEHLLKGWPIDQPVAVVESEKTAMIAAALMPSFLWVAVGSMGAFTLAKLQALTGRKVLAFPDLSRDGSAFTKWRERAIELGHLFASIHVSDILERKATEADRNDGLDIGDHLLRSDDRTVKSSTTTITTLSAPPPPILSRAEVAVKRMAQRNPAINSLVSLLDLDLSRAQVRPL
jgi:hypothetical protein